MATKRFNEKQRARFLAKFDRWDGSAAGFCRKHGLSYQSFLNWRRSGTRPGVEEPTRFVELELQSEPPSHLEARREALAELELGAGMVLRVYPIQGARS